MKKIVRNTPRPGRLRPTNTANANARGNCNPNENTMIRSTFQSAFTNTLSVRMVLKFPSPTKSTAGPLRYVPHDRRDGRCGQCQVARHLDRVLNNVTHSSPPSWLPP